MKDINDCHELIRLLAKKDMQGFLSPAQINRAWEAAEMQRFTEGFDAPAQYQPGRPIGRMAYGLTEKTLADLDRFVERAAYVPSAATPFWTRPPRMLHVIAAVAEYQGALVPVEQVSHLQLGERLASTIVAPDLENPVIVFGAGQAEVFPAGVPRVLITYLRLPTVAEWVGDKVNGRLVYNASKSTQPEWPLDVWNDLVVRALAFLGMNLKAQDVVQFAQLKKQEGV